MLIRLSTENSDPMYRQVVDQIQDAIAAGDLLPDQLLPSIRELAVELGVSVITIKRAYQELENAGLIRARRGMGSFVCPVDPGEMRQAKLDEIADQLQGILVRGRKFNITADDLTRLLRQMEKEG